MDGFSSAWTKIATAEAAAGYSLAVPLMATSMTKVLADSSSPYIDFRS